MASYERQGQGKDAEGVYTAYDKRHGQGWPQQGQGNAPELLPRASAIGTRRLVELTRDGLQTGEEDEHDEWGHLPGIGHGHGDHCQPATAGPVDGARQDPQTVQDLV